MKRKDPMCPKCGDQGIVDKTLKCETCGEQLVYADVDGTLKIAEKERKCPRCETVNSKDVKYCESCGAQVGKHCGYCKSYHFIEDKVCTRTGEPIKEEEIQGEKAPILPKLLAAASIMAILMFGFMMYNTSRKPDPASSPVIVVTPSPVYVSDNTRKPRIDVVFAIDTTGSMGDEIDVVKSKVKDMIRKIASGQPKPHVRYGMVAYRDRGDAFVTKHYNLTDSMDNIISDVNELYADGGGDTPEAVGSALDAAVNQMNWDENPNTRKIIFLIGDAGPHTDGRDIDFEKSCVDAKNKGIKISAIGCSGITSHGENEFREIARITGGQFDYLTYQQVYTQSDGSELRVMKAGEKAYVVTGGREDEWRAGYKTMVSEKKAKAVDDSELRSMTAAPGVSMKAEMRNNLDEMLTQQVQMEAEDMGVKYKKE